MKRLALQLIIFLGFCLQPIITKAQQDVSLMFKFVTKNTIAGYDHVSKLIVYCDDKQIGESTAKLQSLPNSIRVKVPKGKHKITATLFALYKGNWERRSVENDYSFDFEYNKTGNWKVNNTINLTFDISDEVVSFTEKIPVIVDEENSDLQMEKKD